MSNSSSENNETVVVKSAFNDGKEFVVKRSEIEAQAAGYQRVADEAEAAGLIHAASGGVIVIVHPDVQIEEGIYHKIQVATGNGQRCKLVEADDRETAVKRGK